MGMDSVLTLLGEFGRYQKRICFLLSLPAILCAFHTVGNVFLHANPDHRCQLPDEFPNASYVLPPDKLNTSFPFDEKTKTYSSCSMIQAGEIIPCTGYIYDNQKYTSSIVIEWNLVCDKAYLKALADTLFMIGVLLGAIIFGELSDRYGRKLIFFISLVIQVIFGTIAAFAPEYWSYALSRAVVGSTTSGVFLVAYVIAMEMVGAKYRLVTGVVSQMFFSVGFMLTAGIAYLIEDWRHLQLGLTLPGIGFLCYWWFIPESICWLLTNHRVPEATKLVQKMAKEAKVRIPDNQLQHLLIGNSTEKVSNEKKATILDIAKHPTLITRSLIIFLDWFVNCMTYYGLSWNTSNLGGNDYLNFLVSGAVEIPAFTFLLFTLNRFGRKAIFIGCMIVAGMALLCTAAVPNNLQWLTITLAMFGKFAITASYGTIYVFSTEQFPTVIRNSGLGAGSMSARMGGIFAPFINLTNQVWQPLPLVIFGILALVSGFLSLLLPDTTNETLPETIEDWNQFGKQKKIDIEKLNS